MANNCKDQNPKDKNELSYRNNNEFSENKINFLLRIAKKLAINISNEKERFKAFKWIKAIESSNHDDQKRTKSHALQLLIICLERKELVGPFKNLPDKIRKLNEYEWTYQPIDIINLLVNNHYLKHGRPQINVDISGNLNELCAYQEIPEFGMHFYYAYSPEEIPKWNNLNKSILPRSIFYKTNLTNPDSSLISQMETNKKFNTRVIMSRKQESEQKTKSEFLHDISVIDDKEIKLKDKIFTENPSAKNVIETNIIKDVISAGKMNKTEIAVDVEMNKESGQMSRPHLDTIDIRKEGSNVMYRKKLVVPSRDDNKTSFLEEITHGWQVKKELQKSIEREKYETHLKSCQKTKSL